MPAVPASSASALTPVAIVDPNKMLPAVRPAVSMSTLPVSVTAWLKVMSSSVVSISPDVVILPEPLVILTAPSAMMSPPAAIVTALVPLPLIVSVPPAVVVKLLVGNAIVPWLMNCRFLS